MDNPLLTNMSPWQVLEDATVERGVVEQEC